MRNTVGIGEIYIIRWYELIRIDTNRSKQIVSTQYNDVQL